MDFETHSLHMESFKSRRRSAKPWISPNRGSVGSGSMDIDSSLLSGSSLESDILCQLARKGRVAQLKKFILDNPFSALHCDERGLHLLHYAVLHNQPLIAEVILKSDMGLAGINCQDVHKRTPLHYAVSTNNLYMISMLLIRGAAMNIMDDTDKMAIHIAAAMKDVAPLKALLQFDDDPNIKGEAGYTPLHFAALHNNHEAIKLLLQNKADLGVPCISGAPPVHIAAKSGSVEALSVMLEEGKKYGLPPTTLLDMTDAENHDTFSAAVNGGHSAVVELCLKYGSSLLLSSIGDSTPVHQAAAQGAEELLQTMDRIRPVEMKIAMERQDGEGRTPLHWAALFNHIKALEYLLKQCPKVDVSDVLHQTPLILAASSGAQEAVLTLIQHNAPTNAIDYRQRNFLHLAVRNGMDLVSMMPVLKTIPNITTLVNDRDNLGKTALHYSANSGSVSGVKALLELGANILIKDKNKQSPFHVALTAGRYNTILVMLASPKGNYAQNDRDGEGLTPIHLAALYKRVNILSTLVQRGALMKRDGYDNTALHLAAAGGCSDCVQFLLSVRIEILDCCNKNRDTALHLAARNGHAELVKQLLVYGARIIYNQSGRCFFDDVIENDHADVAAAIVESDRWEECLNVYSEIYGLLSFGLIAKFPTAFRASRHLMGVLWVVSEARKDPENQQVLDKCVVKSELEPKSKNYHVTYNFKYLRLESKYKTYKHAKNAVSTYSPLFPLELMVIHKRASLLSHPLTIWFLRIKWIKYGFLATVLNLMFYVLFLQAITSIVISGRGKEHYDPRVLGPRSIWSKEHNRDLFLGILPSYGRSTMEPELIEQRALFQWDFQWFSEKARNNKTPIKNKFELFIIIIHSCFHLANTLFMTLFQRPNYLAVYKVLIETVLYCACLLFAVPFFFGYSTHLQWSAAAVAVFLAWFNCMVNLQRIDYFGTYILMFIEVIKTLFKVLLIFIFLITAFGLAFYVMLNSEPLQANEHPLQSIYRTFILIFELSYLHFINQGYIDNSALTAHFGHLAFFFLALFLFFLPLLLVNLMIGLGVGDIATVRTYAKEKKLASQVQFLAQMESRLPFLTQSVSDTIILHPNRFGALGKYIARIAGLQFEKETTSRDFLSEELHNLLKSIEELQVICNRTHDVLQDMMAKLGMTREDSKMNFSSTNLREGTVNESNTRTQTAFEVRRLTRISFSNMNFSPF